MDVPQIILESLEEECRTIENEEDEWPLGSYHESHMAFVVGAALLRHGASRVVLEPSPFGYEGTRCDFFAACGAVNWWAEIKRGWHGYGEGWSSKPAGQLQTWLADLWRLRRITGVNECRAFVLIHYRQEGLRCPRQAALDIGAVASELAEQWHTGSAKPERSFTRINAWDAVLLLVAFLEHLGEVRQVTLPGKGFADGPRLEYRLIVGSF